MHETLNGRYIGHIDTNTIKDGIRTVTGWVVCLDGSALNRLFSKDCKVIDTSNNENILLNAEIIKRPDVVQYYNPVVLQKDKYESSGFSVTFTNTISDCIITINDTPVFAVSIAVNDIDEVIKYNSSARTDLIVVDNFYKNPYKVRKYALAQDFKTNEQYHKGARTQQTYIPSWVGKEFGRLLNMEVTEFVGATGVFQYCVAKDNVVYHYDTQQYAAMVYLSPDAPLQTGTQTFRSKLTKLMAAATDIDAARLNTSKDILDATSFNGNNFYDKHNLELVDSVANVFNRLVIFNARLLHAATSYYGSNKEDGRLFHLYFFNVK
jgi:Family of unknown function (DUF6445)